MPDKPETTPRRLRRLPRLWEDRTGAIRFLLTLCVDGRTPVLATQTVFDRLTGFLIDSPSRYQWFGHAFVVMPDHLHVMATMGPEPVTLGLWIKAMKAVVAGLEPDPENPGRMRRIPRTWQWQEGFHDHKFRTPESAARKWEYVMLNPVRAGLVTRPEGWPYTGEIVWEEAGKPRLVRGSFPLLDKGKLISESPEP